MCVCVLSVERAKRVAHACPCLGCHPFWSVALMSVLVPLAFGRLWV